ncbi:MAG: NAD+ synthase [Candidatus Heimdallarchaeota archaeon]|nr:NAD+ synthase [Candidatus Heimdallarchaeota archaeon]
MVNNLKLDKSAFEINCEEVTIKIEKFIQETVKNSHTKGVIIGLSGGIDSSVVAALAVRAIGKDKVIGLILPNAKLAQSFEDDARILAEQLGIDVKKIPLADFVTAFTKNVDESIAENQLVIGNAMARFRMILLYGYSNHLNYLVIGTSNKTELMIGYFTKYGDGGVDFEPCGDLYKTHIRLLAKYLNIPKAIIEKQPTAGLWEGQTDEGEIGITYDLLDLILIGREKGLIKDQICSELKIEPHLFDKVENMIKKTEHKRKMPPTLKIV